ncbi:MAG: HEAT repeat domain-containing protein [Deltaproteobacteria bacterium]|nr:HEAT repeat domain-containing protein [Deltaproteobacteria bacterium]
MPTFYDTDVGFTIWLSLGVVSFIPFAFVTLGSIFDAPLETRRRGRITIEIHRKRILESVVALASLFLVTASSVNAESSASRAKCARTASRAQIDSIVSELISADEKSAIALVDELSQICHPLVVPRLVRLIRDGQPDGVTDHVIEALGRIGSSEAKELLKDLTRHRRYQARRLAYVALSAIDAPDIAEIITQGLRDMHPEVRATAALLLAEVGSKRQVETLFWAFSRGVAEAAVAIGQIGDADSVERFNRHLERQPLITMLSGYERFLTRENLPREVKLTIIATLGEVSGNTIREFLMQLLAHYQKQGDAELAQMVQRTINRIPLTVKPDKREVN